MFKLVPAPAQALHKALEACHQLLLSALLALLRASKCERHRIGSVILGPPDTLRPLGFSFRVRPYIGFQP